MFTCKKVNHVHLQVKNSQKGGTVSEKLVLGLQDAGEDSDSSSPLGPRTLLKAPSASSCCFSCSQRGTEVTLWGNLPIPNAETVVGEGATSGKSPKQVTFFSGSQLSFS